jgi:hypothetical protein
MPGQNDPITLSEVLYNEYETMRPREPCWLFYSSSAGDEVENRKFLYRIALERLHLSALALSGGGIRSACVALGVIQALAEAKLLTRFDYLSTVSGGGYIGSWLSAWLYWNKRDGGRAEDVLRELTTRRGHPDREPPPIRQLRAYSSYLTPKLGLTSADTWAAVTQIVRNLLLNWLILIPAICLVVLSIKITAGFLHTAVLFSGSVAAIVVAALVVSEDGEEPSPCEEKEFFEKPLRGWGGR